MKFSTYLPALLSVAQASKIITTAPDSEKSSSQVFLGQVQDEFDASVGQIWGIYSAFGASQYYMRNVSLIEVDGFGPGAIRNITVLGEWAREILDWVRPESHSLAYTLYYAPGLPAVNISGTIELSALDSNTTQILWTARAASVNEGYKDSMRERALNIYINSIAKVKAQLAGNYCA